MIKTAFALHERLLPPSINFAQPNPRIDFQNSPFYVNTELKPWLDGSSPRRAGISSFGVGGTNAHVVLEEGPVRDPNRFPERPCYLLPLSAKSENALKQQSLRLAEHLRAYPDTQLADVAFTLQVGRAVFDHRRIVVCSELEDACLKLEEENPNPLDCGQDAGESPSVIFMFPGQGAQFPNMARTLYENEPVFALHFNRCADMLLQGLRLDLRELLYRQANEQAAADMLRETGVTQPAIFSIEYALAQLWMHWGLKPDAYVGHSVGEFTAACLAGVFSIEDALHLVTIRGRLMQEMPKGAMLSVRAPVADVEGLLSDELNIAAVNAPKLVVVSGPFDAIDGLTARLETQKIPHSRLHSSHAFHSAMMDPVVKSAVDEVSRVKRNPPSTPIFSTVTGQWLSGDEAVNPDYWGRNLRNTVRFADAVAALNAECRRIFIEVGPGQTLCTLTKQIIGVNPQSQTFPSLGHAQQRDADYETLITTIGRLWLAGVPLDWNRFGSGQCYRIPLPAYPFERKRHWVEPVQLKQLVGEIGSKGAEGDHGGVLQLNDNSPITVDRLIKKQMQIMAKQLKILNERS